MTETATDPATLPQYNGFPVPWITRWSGEHSGSKAHVERSGTSIQISYLDGVENREDSGLLWIREGIARNGEPMWAEVNTYRQQACMTWTKCQVCGSKINERPIRWLIPTALQKWTASGELTTVSAPTCSACIPLALELCPYLKKAGYQILKVLDYDMWGVQGDFIQTDEETGRLKHIRGQVVPYSRPDLFPHIVARQRIAVLTKYVVEVDHA